MIFGLAASPTPEIQKPASTWNGLLPTRHAWRLHWPAIPVTEAFTASFVKLIGISSALHDIGKVGIRDAILLKPGKFKEEERRLMQLHATIGGQCVQDIEARLGNSNFLQMAQIVLCHHER